MVQDLDHQPYDFSGVLEPQRLVSVPKPEPFGLKVFYDTPNDTLNLKLES